MPVSPLTLSFPNLPLGPGPAFPTGLLSGPRGGGYGAQSPGWVRGTQDPLGCSRCKNCLIHHPNGTLGSDGGADNSSASHRSPLGLSQPAGCLVITRQLGVSFFCLGIFSQGLLPLLQPHLYGCGSLLPPHRPPILCMLSMAPTHPHPQLHLRALGTPSPHFQALLHLCWCRFSTDTGSHPCSPRSLPWLALAIHRDPSFLCLRGPLMDTHRLGLGTRTLLLVMTSWEVVTRQPASAVRGVCSVI